MTRRARRRRRVQPPPFLNEGAMDALNSGRANLGRRALTGRVRMGSPQASSGGSPPNARRVSQYNAWVRTSGRSQPRRATI